MTKYNIEDYLNKTIGNYKILRFSHKKGTTSYWYCECKCGNARPIQVSQIMNNPSTYCNKCKFSKSLQRKSKLWKGGDYVSATLFTNIQYNAKHKRNIPFKIDIPYLDFLWIKQGGRCSYSGELLTLPVRGDDKAFTASLDRIDSKKGYIKNNVQWVSKEVNMMKQALTEKRFLQLCKKITEKT